MKGKKELYNIFRDYMEYFLVYALFGWIYESVWCCMIYHRRGFINRGFLFGPWLPIYGFGFFIILGIFTLLKVKKPLWVFVVGTVVVVVVVCSEVARVVSVGLVFVQATTPRAIMLNIIPAISAVVNLFLFTIITSA